MFYGKQILLSSHHNPLTVQTSFWQSILHAISNLLAHFASFSALRLSKVFEYMWELRPLVAISSRLAEACRLHSRPINPVCYGRSMLTRFGNDFVLRCLQGLSVSARLPCDPCKEQVNRRRRNPVPLVLRIPSPHSAIHSLEMPPNCLATF